MVRRMRADRERQSIAIHNRHDFHAFSALGRSDLRAPTLSHHEGCIDDAFFFVQPRSRSRPGAGSTALSNEALPVQAMVLLFERGAAVSYRYSFEDLLVLLHGHAPAKVDAVALHRRRVEHGYLSVGLKIHCLGDGRPVNQGGIFVIGPAHLGTSAHAEISIAEREHRFRLGQEFRVKRLLDDVPFVGGVIVRWRPEAFMMEHRGCSSQ
jgi:hypothetical protein